MRTEQELVDANKALNQRVTFLDSNPTNVLTEDEILLCLDPRVRRAVEVLFKFHRIEGMEQGINYARGAGNGVSRVIEEVNGLRKTKGDPETSSG